MLFAETYLTAVGQVVSNSKIFEAMEAAQDLLNLDLQHKGVFAHQEDPLQSQNEVASSSCLATRYKEAPVIHCHGLEAP